MKEHISQNPERTRRAVAVGKLVCFFRRNPQPGRYSSPKMVWKDTYQNHEQAARAVDAFVQRGKILMRDQMQ